jgi:hypothetical protein
MVAVVTGYKAPGLKKPMNSLFLIKDLVQLSNDKKPKNEKPFDPVTWLPLFVVCLSLGIEAYDACSIPVAISAIVSDLNTGQDHFW